MQILCPSCATGYEIPEAHLQRPRRLRCAQCGGEWRVPALQAGIDPAPPEPAPEPAAESRADTPGHASELPPRLDPGDLFSSALAATRSGPPDRRGAILWAMLWVLSLVLIASALFALWHVRVRIEHAWPPSERLYRLLGVHASHEAGLPGPATRKP